MLDYLVILAAFLLIAVGVIGLWSQDERNNFPGAISLGFGICILITMTWVYLN